MRNRAADVLDWAGVAIALVMSVATLIVEFWIAPDATPQRLLIDHWPYAFAGLLAIGACEGLASLIRLARRSACDG